MRYPFPSSLYRLLLALLALVAAGCETPSFLDGSRVVMKDRIFFCTTGPHREVRLESILPDGTGRRVILTNNVAIAGAPHRNQFPVRHAYVTPWGEFLWRGKGLGIMGIDGNLLVQVPQALSSRAFSISPNGEELAGVDEVSGILYLVNLDGSSFRRLVWHADTVSPTFSPNGDYIAYVEKNILYAVSKNGGAPVSLATDVVEREPISWSRDGSKIVYVQYQPGVQRWHNVSVVDAHLGYAINVSNRVGHDSRPVISPDGKRVVFFAADSAFNIDLHIVANDGNGLRPVLITPADRELYAHWSPDATQLIFTSMNTRSGVTRLNIFDLETETVRVLVDSVCGPAYWDYSRR